MTIFNTLNSRGKPLANADILKGRIFETTKHKEQFAECWKELESKEENEKIKNLDFLFTQLMYIAKAEADNIDTTVSNIVNFFTKENEKYLDIDDNDTMSFLTHLADFWIQPENYLNNKTMMYMSILDKFPNASWKSFVSCLVWKNKQYFKNEEFDKDNFSKDFEHLLVLIKLITLPFVNRQTETKLILERVFKINANILHNRDLFHKHNEKYEFPIFEGFYTMFKKNDTTKLKYILFLYAYIFNNFEEIIDDSKIEVEHILPKQWQNANFDGWDEETHKKYLEQIGNKMLLEKKLNIKCKDHFFAKKQEEYKKSKFQEAKKLSQREKRTWDKEDIEQRNQKIYEAFKDFLKLNVV
ncbi:HNH endonuclease family protein [Helicobacter himalayensis]|uniref:HNH endonuclease family protein n=1 Tax=Helicobacter himalayensis TaxID=1591088 RepID=UPI003D6E5A02